MSSTNAWTCNECSVDNSFIEDKCQECQSPRAETCDNAVCPFCAGRLPNRSDKCPHCLYKLTNGPLHEWHCPACTFTNHATLLNCEMCELTRPGGKLVSVTSNNGKSMGDKIKEGIYNLVRSKSLSEKQEFGIDVVKNDQTWKCGKCAYDCNPNWNQICDTCSNPKVATARKVPTSSVSVWLCPKTDCRTMNSEVYQICPKCLRPRENTRTWTCKHCQHKLNELTSLKCQGCGEPKFDVKNKKKNFPVLKKEEKPTFIATELKREFWACPRCTFHNELKATTCEMCQSGKQSSSSKSMKEVRIIEEHGSEQLRLEIIRQCERLEVCFLDDEFRPEFKSLYGTEVKPGLVDYKWKRPMDTQPNSYADQHERWTVLNNPKASDIKQGILGDCWLLSALAVIAEKPHLLEKILVTKEISKHGVYQVHLCKDGAWVVVTIDDHLPCTDVGHLVYSSANRRQLWVPLIEKAMAKMYGSYDALTAGKSIEGMSALTGAACESIELQPGKKSGEQTVDKDGIWLSILSMREAGFLLGASCGAGNMVVDEEQYQAVGLRPRHAYSVLDVQFVQNKYKLLCLRNPWGSCSWTGEWSEHHPVWSQLRQTDLNQLKRARDSEGTFWISIEDVLTYFDSIDACKLRSHWQEIRLCHKLPSGGDQQHQVIQIHVESHTSEVEILLFQADERGDFRASLMDLCIMIFRGTKDNLGPLVEASMRKPRKFINCYKVLEPGEYVVVTTAFNHWKQNGVAADCVVVLHSSKEIRAEIIPAPPTIVADAVCKLAKARGNRHPDSQGMRAYYLSEGWAGMILIVENVSSVFLRVESLFDGSLNVVSTREVLTTVDVIPPKHIQVVQVMTQLEQSDSYHVTNKLRHKFMPLDDQSPLFSQQDPPLQPWTRPVHTPRQMD